MALLSRGWRQRVIFHQSERPLDPDEARFRFRRKFVHAALLAALGLLLYPIVRERSPSYRTMARAREMAAQVLATRLRASTSRAPTALELASPGRWQRVDFATDEDCTKPGSPLDQAVVDQTDSVWRALLLQENDPSGVGKDVTRLCFDPRQGLIVDGIALEKSWLYLLVALQEDVTRDREDRSRQVIISDSGKSLRVKAVSAP